MVIKVPFEKIKESLEEGRTNLVALVERAETDLLINGEELGSFCGVVKSGQLSRELQDKIIRGFNDPIRAKIEFVTPERVRSIQGIRKTKNRRIKIADDLSSIYGFFRHLGKYSDEHESSIELENYLRNRLSDNDFNQFRLAYQLLESTEPKASGVILLAQKRLQKTFRRYSIPPLMEYIGEVCPGFEDHERESGLLYMAAFHLT